MTDRRTRLRALALPLCVAIPLAPAVLCNAVVRPALAHGLGGERRTSGNAVRGHDTWWEFDEAVRAAHPVLTHLLSLHDSLYALLGLAGAAIAVATLFVLDRRKRRRAQG